MDKTLSNLIDCCNYLLDQPLPWRLSLLLRAYRRQLERRIPNVYRGAK